MKRDEFYEIPFVRVVRTTERAVCFEILDEAHWIPKSPKVQVNGDCWRIGDEGSVYVKGWWLEAQGLEYLAEPRRTNRPLEEGMLDDAHKVYRRLAVKYHPDRSPDTAEFMKDLNELWQSVLADVRKAS